MKIRFCFVASAVIAAATWFGMTQRSSAVAEDATASKGQSAERSANDLPPEPEYKPKTRAQLRRSLSAMQYRVTQEEGTEGAFQNKYWNNKQKGRYDCIVCERPLFESSTKYKSGTGWPSFFAPIHEKSVGYKTDRTMFFQVRTEVHCARCEAHLGHVFDDGPRPTGKRFCMNSASLKFVNEKELAKMKEQAAKKDDE